jgi:hypothetical protein
MRSVTTAIHRWRQHRRALHNLRVLQDAIDHAPSPNVRDELIAAAQRQDLLDSGR